MSNILADPETLNFHNRNKKTDLEFLFSFQNVFGDIVTHFLITIKSDIPKDLFIQLRMILPFLTNIDSWKTAKVTPFPKETNQQTLNDLQLVYYSYYLN